MPREVTREFALIEAQLVECGIEGFPAQVIIQKPDQYVQMTGATLQVRVQNELKPLVLVRCLRAIADYFENYTFSVFGNPNSFVPSRDFSPDPGSLFNKWLHETPSPAVSDSPDVSENPTDD